MPDMSKHPAIVMELIKDAVDILQALGADVKEEEIYEGAGVAQTGERLPRKQEVTGSTPVASSTGFTNHQRNLVAAIVNHRVRLEEARKEAGHQQKGSEDLHRQWTEAKRRMEEATLRAEQAQEALEKAEADLRLAILDEAVVNGRLKEIDKEREPEPTAETVDLGRAE